MLSRFSIRVLGFFAIIPGSSISSKEPNNARFEGYEMSRCPTPHRSKKNFEVVFNNFRVSEA